MLRHIVEKQSKALPSVIAQELSLLALGASSEQAEDLMDRYCREAIKVLPEEAEVVRNGNVRVLNKLVGHVMKASKGRTHAQVVHARLKDMLVDKLT